MPVSRIPLKRLSLMVEIRCSIHLTFTLSARLFSLKEWPPSPLSPSLPFGFPSLEGFPRGEPGENQGPILCLLFIGGS